MPRIATAFLALTLPLAAWNPSPPPEDGFDWVQLNSGEWLKGSVERYLDNELVFDSDVLGLLTLDEDDIKFVRTSSKLRVGYETGEKVDGLVRDRQELEVTRDRLEIGEGEVRRRDSGETIAPVDRLVTIASDGESEGDNWSGKVAIGANLREGNTSQVDYNARIELDRITALSRMQFDYLGNFGKTDGTEYANNHRISYSWDRYLSRRLFVRPVGLEYYRDPFQNIAHRGIVGAGIGYELIDNARTDWRIVAGPAYQYLELDTVLAGSSGTESSLAATFNSEFSTEVNEHVDFTSLYRMGLTRESAGLYSHRFENSLSFELTDDLDFDVSLIWDYVQEPTRRADGTLPNQNDLRLMFLLGLEL